MVHRARADELHIRRHHDVSGDALPSKVERIHFRPDIRAAARHSIIAVVGIIFDEAGFRRLPDIGMPLEKPPLSAEHTNTIAASPQNRTMFILFSPSAAPLAVLRRPPAFRAKSTASRIIPQCNPCS